jgi:hypothetical protein
VTTLEWTCARCGERHAGLPFDWGFPHPIYWDGGRDAEDFLEEDLCAWTDDGGRRNYFIRGVLEIPVRDAGHSFTYGVWSSLSEDSFLRVVELWDDPRRVDEPPYFGWLSNEIPDFAATLNLPLDVVTRGLELRPCFELHNGDHPLVAAQRGGVPRDFVRDIAEKRLHPV